MGSEDRQLRRRRRHEQQTMSAIATLPRTIPIMADVLSEASPPPASGGRVVWEKERGVTVASRRAWIDDGKSAAGYEKSSGGSGCATGSDGRYDG